jgi:hypothetical protein
VFAVHAFLLLCQGVGGTPKRSDAVTASLTRANAFV